MKMLTRLTAGTLLAMAAGQAMAATDSVDVKVTGEIVPPACVPAVSGGAVFDYGSIKASSLKQDELNVLGAKTLDFSLTCSSPMKVAFISPDNRAGTAVIGGGPLGAKNSDTTKFYGLGQVNGKNIGNYAMAVGNEYLTIDGSRGYVGILSTDKGATWSLTGYSNVWMDQQNMASVAKKGTTEPVAFKTMTGRLGIQAVINKASELDLTKTVNIDGMVSIQVSYL